MQQSVMVRMLAMGFVLLVLLVPLELTANIIGERATRRGEVAADISKTWGGRQTLSGPMLSVPYRYQTREAGGAVTDHEGTLVLLPETLDVKGTLEPQSRHRGPFSSVVYTARLTMLGRFAVPDVSSIRGVNPDVRWDEAVLSLAVDDPRGIASGLRTTWNGQALTMLPGVSDTGLGKAGVQARSVSVPAAAPSTFEVQMELRGAESLALTPVGNDTTLVLASSWPHPGFTLGQLPTTSRVGDHGFEARWQTSWFARGFPAVWARGAIDEAQLASQAGTAALGVALVQPVDVYQQSERAVKYAVLVIVLTLAVAFVREVTSGLAVHPIQYLFVGFGLSLFYLLLVSLAEHLPFAYAYAAASAAVVGLLSWYWTGVLRSVRHGRVLAFALTALYGYLYMLLRLEDFALLAGATGLFVMLAAVMAMTRHIDWFSLQRSVTTQTTGRAS
ncbi:MAG TPA: cell envelope integrity protein CreD [Luteitalea sp.]|nr:cell envelope integrity protein CreD [Luteitalea sp.]